MIDNLTGYVLLYWKLLSFQFWRHRLLFVPTPVLLLSVACLVLNLVLLITCRRACFLSVELVLSFYHWCVVQLSWTCRTSDYTFISCFPGASLCVDVSSLACILVGYILTLVYAFLKKILHSINFVAFSERIHY